MRPTTLVTLVAPLPAVAIGAFVMSRAGLPPAIWVQDLLAAAVGVLVVCATPGRRTPSLSGPAWIRWFVIGGVAILAGTLLHPGVSGVHRWLSVGPLQVHVGAVLLPPMLVLLGNLDRTASLWAAVLTLGVLALQPDAAQAVSFAVGWSVSAALVSGRAGTRPIVLALAIAATAVLRPDPLAPVPHVEGIVRLAAEQGTLWAAAGLIAIALPALVLLVRPDRRVGAGVAAYLGCTLLASWLGNFPVPFLGYGVAPILGYYLAVAALRRPECAVERPLASDRRGAHAGRGGR